MKTTIKSILFPCLLSFITLVSIFNIYEEVRLLPAAGIFAYNTALFCLFEKLRVYNKNWLSTVIIIVGMILTFMMAGQVVRLQGRQAFLQLGDWFFKTGDTDLHFPMFTFALLLMFIPFLASTVFYFTNVRYNAFFLMLTCMTMFALYAKTFTKIPFMFPAVIIALFILVSIEKRWYSAVAEQALGYRRFIVTGICFVAASAYIAGLFPPAATTPYREQFDEFISGQQFGIPVPMTQLVIDSGYSGAANTNANQDEVLFRVKADYPTYLRRQVFDSWDGERWLHFSRERAPQTWQTEGFARSGLNRGMEITVVTGADLFFLPMPQNSLRLDYPITPREGIGRSMRDEFFIEGRESSGSQSKQGVTYTVQYGTEPAAFGWLIQHGMDAYLESCLELPDYPRRDKVRELAHEITAGLISPTAHEVAAAIEQYFHGGLFTYDLDFTPRSKAVDYFLFDSLTGTCSDFATAMTVLVREAGIPARYVEGYIVEEFDSESGVFLIKTKHSHAFAEVYINGQWVIFEPTVPGTESLAEKLGYGGILAILVSVGVAGALTVVFFVLVLPRIRERQFRDTARSSPPEQQVKMLYNKIYGEFMRDFRLQSRTLSSRDLDKLAQSEYGVELAHLTASYDRVVYGGVSAGDGDFFGTYLALCEKLRYSKRIKNY
jgi:hypothetical protein